MNYQISQEHRNAIIQAVSNSVIPARDAFAMVQILQNLKPLIEDDKLKNELRKVQDEISTPKKNK